MLLADTRSRWEKLAGKKVFFLTGTDEHGFKIQAAAEAKNIAPERFVDLVSKNFKTLASTFNIAYNRFIRTTDLDHQRAVAHFWHLMESKALIYKGSHSGWYSVSDETFYPESQIKDIQAEDGTCKKVSIETGSEVIYQQEENYFFRLSQFQNRLIEFLEANPGFIVPPSKYQEVLHDLKNSKLENLSVSRPSSRLTWGIRVPKDKTQSIYVWFDALTNYLTAASYPKIRNPDTMWPSDTHIVGKDIMRFHCIYWPIFLMAAKIPLPKQVLVHSHWLSEGVKMSKSLGNVVDPIALSEAYGTDPTRFYLMQNASITNDCKFSETKLRELHMQLVNKWANMSSRAAGFNLESAVQNSRQSSDNSEVHKLFEESSIPAQNLIKLLDALRSSIDTLHRDMRKHMKGYNQMKAIQRWWETIELANEFFQHCEPWKVQNLAQDESASEESRAKHQQLLNYITFAFAEAGRVLSICALPFMPTLAHNFLTRWGVKPQNMNSKKCKFGADRKYGCIDKSVSGKLMNKVKMSTSTAAE